MCKNWGMYEWYGGHIYEGAGLEMPAECDIKQTAYPRF